ncbi:hypothetical protein NL533_36385, partial [Klebsiella pneumoniae]|nr:hypothetical protein [Klebsiella pneumoniae]
FIEFGLTAVACILWYLFPSIGAWPVLLVAGGWLWRRYATGQWPRRSALDAPLLLFGLSALCSTLVGFNQGAQWLTG